MGLNQGGKKVVGGGIHLFCAVIERGFVNSAASCGQCPVD